MMEYEEPVYLPIFHLKTNITYYCPDGLVTTDLQEAKEHGYGKDGNRATSFGHDDAFETFDYSVLPVVENLSMKMEKCYGVFLLYFYTDGEEFFREEVYYTSSHVENDRVKPLVGTAENPYNYIDQGVDLYIFERDGYVMVLSAENWESFSPLFTGFRVIAEEFYKAWNQIDFPKPYR